MVLYGSVGLSWSEQAAQARGRGERTARQRYLSFVLLRCLLMYVHKAGVRDASMREPVVMRNLKSEETKY